MKTRIKKMGDTIIVGLDGKVDFETQERFRSDLNKIVNDSKKDEVAKKVVFDFENLEFVGSSGITTLIQSLKEFSHALGGRAHYRNVGTEFQKVMKAFDDTGDFEMIEGSLVNRKLPKLPEQ